jgi:hypothetical protein
VSRAPRKAPGKAQGIASAAEWWRSPCTADERSASEQAFRPIGAISVETTGC